MAKRFRLTATEPLEKDVQSSILSMLMLHRDVAWAHRMNTGAYSVVTNGRRRFVRFGFPGLSDILGQLRDGRVLAIEVKRPSGKATPEQKEFLASVTSNGGAAGIARSVEDAIAIVEQPRRPT